MDKTFENDDLSVNECLVDNANKVTQLSQSNQYDSYSQVSHLRILLKTHNGKKSKKCNQCDYASSQAGHLRTHLKTQRIRQYPERRLLACWSLSDMLYINSKIFLQRFFPELAFLGFWPQIGDFKYQNQKTFKKVEFGIAR